ncbi:MAG: hypothetical protein RLY16_359 [Bacteroidota bacterium]|jgi:hypothetical protein
MKRILPVIIVISTVFISCKQQHVALNDKIKGSDSVAINFFKGDGTMDSVQKVVIVRDAATINRLTALIAADQQKLQKDAGNDASLHFFKMNRVVQDVYYSAHQPNSSQFTFRLQNGYEATSVSKEVKALLDTLRK